ncbi:MAG: AmmeMemoRadiSam system protein B [Desulfobacteraceae bacterium]|nr:MAG: AmmeMemoRadiSam system protein B [Desulfobacteraceae bacterium]
MATRRSDFAGSWYPATESECRRLIEGWTGTDKSCQAPERRFVGGIVPHAGWVFSGRVSCGVIGCLQKGTVKPDTVVVFGKHLHAKSRNYIMKEGEWATPLGNLEVDGGMAEALLGKFSFVQETPIDYEQDNTIELQLPFIKYFFPEAMILPLGVPPAPGSVAVGKSVAETAASMNRAVLIIGSTDLTHYGPNYGFMPKGGGVKGLDWVKNENDKRLRDLVVDMNPERVIQESLVNHNACCAGAVAAAISACKKLGAEQGMELFYTTSYDIRPDSSFVGYTGILFY